MATSAGLRLRLRLRGASLSRVVSRMFSGFVPSCDCAVPAGASDLQSPVGRLAPAWFDLLSSLLPSSSLSSFHRRPLIYLPLSSTLCTSLLDCMTLIFSILS